MLGWSLRSKTNSPVDTFDRQWREMSGLPDWDYLCEEIYQALRQALGAVRGLKILEVGCGTGRISARLASDGAEVVMLDASTAALRLAQEQLRHRDLDGHLVFADMMSLPFPDAVFDAVWSAGVLEHYPDDLLIRALREMRRVTVSGGRVVTMVPNALAAAYRIAIWNGRRTGTWVDELERSFRSLRKPTSKAGLRLESEWSIAPLESEAFFWAHAGVRGLRKFSHRALPLLRRMGLGDYLLVSVAGRDAV